MDQLPKPLLVVQDVEKLRLPVSSYRQSGFTYARFAPFVVYNDAGYWEHNQLNWIVLYLLSMNKGEISESDSNILNQILKVEKLTNDTLVKVKELAGSSPRISEFRRDQRHARKGPNDQDLKAIKDKVNEAFAGKPMGSRMTEVEKSVEELSEEMDGIGKKIDFIASRFGFQN